ncbi:MAG: nucleoside recognition domain-containing protein [Alicyclobacillaceae bacterium]|nr:nucleoside recognition domain-containing protein [Alicyclobacillaceae bacterium]
MVPWTQTAWELLHTVWSALWELSLIVIPLMTVIQILKELRVLESLSGMLEPGMRLLGLPREASLPMVAGLVFGLAYGAGVILQATRERPLSRRDLYLMFVFLILCHAVVEDTLLFVPLGVNALMLLGTRLGSALCVTAVLSRLWRTDRAVSAAGGSTSH